MAGDVRWIQVVAIMCEALGVAVFLFFLWALVTVLASWQT